VVKDISNIYQIGSPKIIVNLRKGVDPTYSGTIAVYSPAPDSVEVYDISQGRNKKWLGDTLRMIFEADEPLPCFIHCAAGKDRTGVLIINRITSTRSYREDYTRFGRF